MLIDVFYQLFLFLGYSIFLVVFKLEDEVLDIKIADAKFSGFRSDGDFILDMGNKF